MIESAGIICYRYNKKTLELELFIVHSTGNFPYWSFPKGQIEENEIPITAAIREFKEETGYDYNYSSKYPIPFISLGKVQQRKDKIVHGFAYSNPNIPARKCKSNMCEYPVGSGQLIYELDQFRWVNYNKTCCMINPAQLPLLYELKRILDMGTDV